MLKLRVLREIFMQIRIERKLFFPFIKPVLYRGLSENKVEFNIGIFYVFPYINTSGSLKPIHKDRFSGKKPTDIDILLRRHGNDPLELSPGESLIVINTKDSLHY
jgi:hypothetical protein